MQFTGHGVMRWVSQHRKGTIAFLSAGGFLVTILLLVKFGADQRLLLDYLALILSPQVVIAIVVILFLTMFRSAIEARIAHLKSLEAPGGIKAQFEAQTQAADQAQKALKEEQPSPPKTLEIQVGDQMTLTDDAKARLREAQEAAAREAAAAQRFYSDTYRLSPTAPPVGPSCYVSPTKEFSPRG